MCGHPGVCALWTVGGCGGVAVVMGALGCCQGSRVLLSSLCSRRCGHLATRRGAVAWPRLVDPHERSNSVVLPVSVRLRRVTDRPASAFGHTPPHERYVTHFNDRGSGARWHAAVQFPEVSYSICEWLSEQKYDKLGNLRTM